MKVSINNTFISMFIECIKELYKETRNANIKSILKSYCDRFMDDNEFSCENQMATINISSIQDYFCFITVLFNLAVRAMKHDSRGNIFPSPIQNRLTKWEIIIIPEENDEELFSHTYISIELEHYIDGLFRQIMLKVYEGVLSKEIVKGIENVMSPSSFLRQIDDISSSLAMWEVKDKKGAYALVRYLTNSIIIFLLNPYVLWDEVSEIGEDGDWNIHLVCKEDNKEKYNITLLNTRRRRKNNV